MRIRALFSGIVGASLASILVISVLSVLPTNIETEETLLPGQSAGAITVNDKNLSYILSTKLNCVENTIGSNMVGTVDFDMQIISSSTNKWTIEVIWTVHNPTGAHLDTESITLVDNIAGGKIIAFTNNFTPLTASWSLPSHIDTDINDVGTFKLKFTESTGPTSLNEKFQHPSCTQDIT